MGIFDALKTDKEIKPAGDNLGGFGAMESGAYRFTIDAAFTEKSAGGALALNLHMKGTDNRVFRHKLWVTSGDKKGNKNFYINKKTNEKHYLPGFNIANAVCELTTTKEISEMDTETKTLNLYNTKEKKEVPTDVDMVVELIGEKIILGILKQKVDKTADDGTGNYVPTGETRDINEIDAVFRDVDQLTITEVRANASKPVFLGQWAERWKGKTQNRATKTGVTNGTPKGAGAAPASDPIFK